MTTQQDILVRHYNGHSAVIALNGKGSKFLQAHQQLFDRSSFCEGPRSTRLSLPAARIAKMIRYATGLGLEVSQEMAR